jgi:hypothetical protein
MHWSCPHCGVALALAANTLNGGWSFSKCYKCGGFALIRRAEVNVVKVDKAPPGEPVVLPGPAAAQEEATFTGAFKPLPRPFLLQVPGRVPQPKLESPSPAFEETRKIPIGIKAASLLAILSGAYLYFQGEELLRAMGRSAAGIPASAAQLSPAVPASAAAQAAQPIAQSPIQPEDSPKIIDKIQSSAMAPVPAEPVPSWVQIRLPKVNIHSGPGLAFSVVGVADSGKHYEITDWSNQWFKIRLKAGAAPSNPVVGWVRNDLVQVVPADSINRPSGPPSASP